jgi:hypothetical protein
MLASLESYQHVLGIWRAEQDAADAARLHLESLGWCVIPPGTPWLQLAAWPCGSLASSGGGCDLPLR